MIAAISAGLISASISVLGTITTKAVFEQIIRKVLITVLKKIVASTENTVDDELVAPIIKELEK